MDPQGMHTSGQRRMVVHYQIRQSLVFLLFASTIFTHLVYFTTAQPELWEFTCWKHHGNYTEDSPYVKNLDTVLHHLRDTNNGYGFFNYSAGEGEGGPDAAYAVALCRGDVGPDDCRRCVDDATQSLRQVCPNEKKANGWYDNCLLNYSNDTLLHSLDTLDDDPAGIGWDDKVSDLDEFKMSMESLFPKLQVEAAMGGSLRKYAVGNTSEPTYGFLYGLMQCTPDLSEDQCIRCLTESFNYSLNNPDTISRRYYRPNCVIRYGIHPFFNATWYPPPAPSSSPSPSALSLRIPPPSPEEGKKTNKSLIIGSVAAASTIGILILVFLFITFRRKSRGQGKDLSSETQVLSSNRFDRGAELQQMEGDKTGEMNYYSLTTIQGATDNFSPDNKLGEGGFGPVYRGKLDDGKEIAVKRLFKNSRQGQEEFKTEVQLIIKLQHKNLVQLLGYCIEGNERLLVYEYMPNTSVDAFLFDPAKCKELNWPRRANIAIGVAKGLRYLHEDSRLKIIHRDMKASNVLLDHEMNPKISDFGTARLFGANQSDANTSKIVGTYGYMAPEYAMEGVISIKSDVYSYGVLLLEMISGKRNMGFYNQEHRRNLLSNAWRLWRDGKGEELIDQNLIDECPVNEALRWIQIGLLCVQEDPNNRPTMSIVVFMLESQSMILPEPTEPPMGFGRSLAFDESSTSAASTEVSSSYPKSTSASHLLR